MLSSLYSGEAPLPNPVGKLAQSLIEVDPFHTNCTGTGEKRFPRPAGRRSRAQHSPIAFTVLPPLLRSPLTLNALQRLPALVTAVDELKIARKARVARALLSFFDSIPIRFWPRSLDLSFNFHFMFQRVSYFETGGGVSVPGLEPKKNPVKLFRTSKRFRN